MMNKDRINEMLLYTIIDLLDIKLGFVKKMDLLQQISNIYVRNQNVICWEKQVYPELKKIKDKYKNLEG